MKRIYYDLETLPATEPEVVQRIKDSMKPPGNMSKPETIQKWMDDPDNIDNAVRKTALNAAHGQILCIGYAIDDEDPVVIEGGPGKEKDAITEFVEIVRKGTKVNKKILVGHNNIGFDNKFLSQRMLVHGMGPLFMFKLKHWELPTEDTMRMWTGGNPNEFVTLDELCRALGIESSKDGIDGSKVYDEWKAGNDQDIFDYCAKDVTVTRNVYKRLRG